MHAMPLLTLLPRVPIGYTEDPRFWYEDGTAILCAENRIYRVHSGILSSESNAFREILALGRPMGSDVEGVTVIELEEEWRELSCVLNVIYHGSKYVVHKCRDVRRR